MPTQICKFADSVPFLVFFYWGEGVGYVFYQERPGAEMEPIPTQYVLGSLGLHHIVIPRDFQLFIKHHNQMFQVFFLVQLRAGASGSGSATLAKINLFYGC